MPYWSLYLQTLGFNAQAIGELISMSTVARIISPNLWGWVGDHTGRHVRIVRLCAFLAMLLFLGVWVKQTYVWIAMVMIAFGFFWSAVLPQFEAVVFAKLRQHSHSHRYTHLRLWGSVGFISSVVLLGWLFESVSVTYLPMSLFGLLVGLWLSSLLVPEHIISSDTSDSQESFLQVLKRSNVIPLLMVCFLMQVSHGPYYTFYTIYLEHHNYSRDVIGQLWALGVLAEIGIFLIMHQLLQLFSLRFLLLLSLSFTTLRWLLIGYSVEWWIIIVFAQLLHAASFGMFHGVAIQFIRHSFQTSHQGKGQAIYTSFGFGAGSAVGSFLSGYTWETLGPQLTYTWAALLCLVAMEISERFLKGQKCV